VKSFLKLALWVIWNLWGFSLVLLTALATVAILAPLGITAAVFVTTGALAEMVGAVFQAFVTWRNYKETPEERTFQTQITRSAQSLIGWSLIVVGGLLTFLGAVLGTIAIALKP